MMLNIAVSSPTHSAPPPALMAASEVVMRMPLNAVCATIRQATRTKSPRGSDGGVGVVTATTPCGVGACPNDDVAVV